MTNSETTTRQDLERSGTNARLMERQSREQDRRTRPRPTNRV